jgi:hypothetical protein
MYYQIRVYIYAYILLCKQTFQIRSEFLTKPHLFVILTAIGWFILNIQSDLFWHRYLERQTLGTPRMYTLSLSKSIKRSNYREFLKVKNILFMYTISVYIRGVPNVCLSKHRGQKRSDWMFRMNHPIAVNITNKCGLVKN